MNPRGLFLASVDTFTWRETGGDGEWVGGGGVRVWGVGGWWWCEGVGSGWVVWCEDWTGRRVSRWISS